MIIEGLYKVKLLFGVSRLALRVIDSTKQCYKSLGLHYS